MKRSGPPARRTPLKSDPAKQRAWQERSAPLTSSGEGPKRTGGPDRRKAAAVTRARPRAEASFREAARERAGGRCAVCGGPGTDPHHVLPQRTLRGHVASLRIPAKDARSLLTGLLSDARNAVWLCRQHHEDHETASRRLPRSCVPSSAWTFAREVMGEPGVVLLERLYPEA